MIQLDKKELRKRALKARHELSIEKKTQYDSLIFDYLKEYLNPYQTIGVYVSKEEEVDTHHLIEYLLNHNKVVLVPKTNDKTLTFHQIHSFNDLKKGVFDVLEPVLEDVYPILDIDIMIVPIVAYDQDKNRIGYGKGYYDAILKECAYTIGIAYPEQEIKHIPSDNWDIPLHEIITITQDYRIHRIL